jgi:hypothetical protein
MRVEREPNQEPVGPERDAAEARPARMFGPGAERTDEVERINRRRVALLGLATGAVMALIVLVCILLLFLAVSSN